MTLIKSDNDFLKSLKFECLHKVQVINPNTGDNILVPCGTCYACLLKKSYSNEIRAKVQKHSSRFAYFVSLSYDVYNCPSYTITTSPLDSGLVLCNVRDSCMRTRFLRDKHLKARKGYDLTPLEPFTFTCTKEYLERYTSQANLAIRRRSYDKRFENTYGYLNRRDLQLFMKRFRKYLYQYSDYYEPIHSYLVGEYGIEHFRPHFHLLLFFDSEKLAENVGRALRDAWPFGRVDFSQDRGDAISYVSAYLNSFTFLPVHLKQSSQFKPFGRFSNHFGWSAFKDSIEKGKQGDFSHFFNGKNYCDHGRYLSVRPWTSIESSCFFEPAKSRYSDVPSLFRLCTNAIRFFQRPFFKRIKQTVGSYCSAILKSPGFLDYIVRRVSSAYHRIDYELEYILNYIGYSPGFYHSLLSPGGLKIFQSRIYRFFRSVHNFLITWDFSIFSLDYNENTLYFALSNSLNYYHEKSYLCFKDFVKNRNSYPYGLDYYFWRITETLQGELRETPLGKRLVQYQRFEVENRIKHRELNEKNRFFVSS